jgi:hypothetical protein
MRAILLVAPKHLHNDGSESGQFHGGFGTSETPEKKQRVHGGPASKSAYFRHKFT